MKHKTLLITIITCSFGYNLSASLADIDSFDIDQWQGLYNSIAGARSDAPDYYGAEKDNIALNSYNNFQQNYDSVPVSPGSLENIANDVTTNVSAGGDWIPQTEPQNIGIPDVTQPVNYQIPQSTSEDPSYQAPQSLTDEESSLAQYAKYYPVVKTVVVPVEQIVNYEVERLVPTPIERPVPWLVPKYVFQAEPYGYPVHIPIYKHTYHRVPQTKNEDDNQDKNIDTRRSYRRRRNYYRRPNRYRFYRPR